MKSMMKRNDGYALSYVLVVLLVLAAIALAVMTLSLNAVKRQEASFDQMKDKYAAQGYVEQVAILIEDIQIVISDELTFMEAMTTLQENTTIPVELAKVSISHPDEVFNHVIVDIETGTAKVIAEYELVQTPVDSTDDGIDNPVVDNSVICRSYKTKVISSEGGTEE